MVKKRVVGIIILSALIISGAWLATAAAQSKPEAKKKQPAVKVEACYGCHDTVKQLHAAGKHGKNNCVNCHSGDFKKHMENPGPDTRPVTDTSWEACGACHKEQFESFMKVAMHRPARDEKSQLTNRSPNPFWDKLMAGHGFTKEHGLTRSHVNMLTDHYVVDRAYGGRFQGKNGWNYILEKGKAWDILMDTKPTATVHKSFITQGAAAANPVCLQCKTQDNILGWAYLGDKVEGKTTFDRTSFPPAIAKASTHGLNCFYCHDPHAAKPRVVRDGLIAALTRDAKDTIWHKDENRTNFKIVEMGERGFKRKIAILDKYDTRLQCGQCHVEYNCNDGYDPRNPDTSKKTVGYDSPLTNHFPYKDVFGLYDHYRNQVNFLDFKHTLTGGLLWKAQHPEAEAYYNSKHGQKGIGCDACHTPKMKDKKTGKMFTSHFAVTPKVQLKETCLSAKCHPKWTEEEAKYSIDSIKAFGKGKMRKAEFWLAALIDKIVEGKKAGLAADVIAKAQDHHLKAHILWEFWTAENSDGFHNPEMARESLTKSVDESMAGIKVINDALGAPKTAAAAPAPAAAKP